ncbi:serine hydrolase [Glaciecola sp. 1036]|uniref:serine hydrolase n=1 Tax=Alteromonadaceae TaxID=72275 RepID=UPI003CFE7397
MSVRWRIALFSTLASLLFNANAQMPPLQLDKDALANTVTNALEAFNTPGMSVAITLNGEIIHAEGYGLANVEQETPVTGHTYFRLASTSKAFTAAGLAVLVDEGLVNWDDKVIDYLPEFRLKDSYATEHFTVMDLLTHNSGLVSGAGDSMIWPEPSGFSRSEVVENLKYLTPEYAFKSQYAYSNVLYITAGQLIERVAKVPFDQFIESKVFAPLDMNCFVGAVNQEAVEHSAMSYGYDDEKGIYAIPRNAITGDALMSAAAGGMVCNAYDMAKWAKALATKTNLPFSQWQLEKMWQGHTILSVSDTDYEWDGTHFNSYGLGWRISNIGPYKFISHTGTLSGYQAYVGILPELELGIVVLNNGSNYGARGSIMQTIVKAMLGASAFDNTWITAYQEYRAERQKRSLERYVAPEITAKMAISAEDVIGEYQDTWFGSMTIYREDDELRIKSSRMKTLTGTLSPFQDNRFKIDWDNENAQSDAFIIFDLNASHMITGASLHPYSVRQQSNHEYRDMYFSKVEKLDISESD